MYDITRVFDCKKSDVFGSLIDYGRWSLTMCKSWFHMEVIINSYVMGKGGKRLGILILSNTKCGFRIYYYIEVRIFSHGWMSLLYPILKCFSPPTPYLNTCQIKYQQVLMLIHYLCRFCTERCSLQKGGQVFHGQNPVTEQYFHKLEKENN